MQLELFSFSELSLCVQKEMLEHVKNYDFDFIDFANFCFDTYKRQQIDFIKHGISVYWQN